MQNTRVLDHGGLYHGSRNITPMMPGNMEKARPWRAALGGLHSVKVRLKLQWGPPGLGNPRNVRYPSRRAIGIE